MDDLNSSLVKDENLVNEIRKRIKIGVHWDTETLSSDKKNKTVSDISQRRRVCQVFCLFLVMIKEKDLKIKGSGNKFCQIILEAMYENSRCSRNFGLFLNRKDFRFISPLLEEVFLEIQNCGLNTQFREQ